MKNFEATADELKKAYADILTWWSTEAFNKSTNQYYGFIDHFGKKDANAPLGIIMYSRILWSFSAASIFSKNADYLNVAKQTKAFLENHFYDKSNGGYFWEISAQRQALITKKQTYAQAFVLYGLCEYYAVSKDEKALTDALELFDLMEIHSLDKEFGGYFEAYTQEWTQLDDVRLSPVDQNNPKSMNTNLHVLEAYTRLLSITGNEKVKTALTNLAEVFYKYIIDKDGHLQLFFDKNWNSQVREHSYGHDIETSWLLWDAIETIGNESMKANINRSF
ncbi:MAG: AGE family epimerase/isomerase [Bacteroidales bacterium]|nr:AGE family epimerase/isomerase [Bacteroidales bacterium]